MQYADTPQPQSDRESERQYYETTCALSTQENFCPHCYNEVTPDAQGHCPICQYCLHCEI